MTTLQQLQTEFKRAYDKSKRLGTIPETDLPTYDFAIEQAYSFRGREGKLLWRRFQRRASKMYCENVGQPYTLDIDWASIKAWILDNLVPLLMILLKFLPVFIGRR